MLSRLHFSTAIVLLCFAGPTVYSQTPSASFVNSSFSPLQRRSGEDLFRRTLSLDPAAPSLATDTEANDAFARGGEWTFELASGIAYDSNPLGVPSPSKGDWRWNWGGKVGYTFWREKSQIVIAPELTFGGQRYNEFQEVDNDRLGASLGITFRKLPLNPTLAYGGGWVFESGFGDNAFTEHVVSLSIGDEILLGPEQPKGTAGKNVVKQLSPPKLGWKLAGGHGFTDPSFLEYSFGGFGLTLQAPITERLSLTAEAAVGYRQYHDFPVDRDTWSFEASAGLSYVLYQSPTVEQDEKQLKNTFGALVLTAGVSYTHSDERFPGDYNQAIVGLKISWQPGVRKLFGLPSGYTQPENGYPK